MRHPRRVAVAILAAVAVFAPVDAGNTSTPPTPDTSTPVYAGLPTGWTFEPVAPPVPGAQADYVHVEGDAPAAWGTGSLRLDLGSSSEGRLTFPQSLAGLVSASVWVRADLDPVPPDFYRFDVVVAGVDYRGSLPTSSTWVAVDLGRLPLHPTTDPGQTTTLLALAQEHPTTADLSLAAFNATDGQGTTQVYVDGWTWTANGATRQLDFEGPHLITECTLLPAATTITAGSPAVLSGTLTDASSSPVSGRPVEVWGGRPGIAWSPVATGTTSGQGRATMSLWPTRHTSYLLSHDQSATRGRCLSGSVQVLVRSKVTMRIADTSIRKGGRIIVTGAVSPARSGLKVSLWRGPDFSQLRVEAARTTADGHYRIAVRATHRGVWRLQTSVPEREDNLAGASVVRHVRVG